MSKKDLQNKRLDEIGRGLLEAAAIESDEIEQIVAAPHLFESVKAKIKTEQSRRKPKRFVINLWNWRAATASFALLIVAAAGAFLFIKAKDAQALTAQIDAPKIKTPGATAENSPQTDEIKYIKATEVKNPAVAQRVDFKTDAPKPKNQARKTNLVKYAQAPRNETEGAFYSLALAGNWEADGEDLQIVRAELSRSQLFALGVNLPVENESAKIKTDLLVGSNGVPRAIRFVE